ncbi:type IV secretory system conjugative DNA transfer family protein [Actinocorallia lasiicapitis]
MAAGGLTLAVLAGLVYQKVKNSLDGQRKPRMKLKKRVKWRTSLGPGFATRGELVSDYGLKRARQYAAISRPSLTKEDRKRKSWRKYATFLGWSSMGWVWRSRCYVTFGEIVLTIAGPQRGKSATAIGRIVDAPGPVVATSIRGDLVRNSAGLRAMVGTIHVFDPEGVGDYASTFAWDPVEGCQDPRTAWRRAANMVNAINTSGVEDKGFWNNAATLTLSAYMHAAALAGRNIMDVYRWFNMCDWEPWHILTAEERRGTPSEQAATLIYNYIEMNGKTRDSVKQTLTQVLMFVHSPDVVRMVTPPPGHSIDFVQFLRSRDTIYLVASGDANSPVPPIITAWLAELKHYAVILGSRSKAKRLDPPLTLELDEIANVSPIPIVDWSSYSAGSGIRMNIYSQTWAQIEDRYGERGANALWSTVGAVVVHYGCQEHGLLDRINRVVGTEYVLTHMRRTRDVTGKMQREPQYGDMEVLPPHAVRMIPKWHAVVVRGEAKPTIVRQERFWKRSDFKAWQSAGARVPLMLAPKISLDVAVGGGLASNAGMEQQAELVAMDDLRRRRAEQEHRERQRGQQQGPPASWGGRQGHVAPPLGLGPQQGAPRPDGPYAPQQPPQQVQQPQAVNETPGWYRPADPEPPRTLRPRRPWDPPEGEL